MTGEQRSLVDGDALRDKGIAQVLDHQTLDWKAVIQNLIEAVALERGDAGFTSDDVHEAAEKFGLSEPKHHNAYGAAIKTAERAGRIKWTGHVKKSERAQAHSRMLRVWVWS